MEMCSVRVSQGMNRCVFLDATLPENCFQGSLHGVIGDVVGPRLLGEEVGLWTHETIVGTQKFQSLLRQRDRAILASFAVANEDLHSLAIDILRLHVSAFRQTETAGVDEGEGHLGYGALDQ